jgi:hypothetical protein
MIARKLQRSVQAIASRKSHLKGRLVEIGPEGEGEVTNGSNQYASD